MVNKKIKRKSKRYEVVDHKVVNHIETLKKDDVQLLPKQINEIKKLTNELNRLEFELKLKNIKDQIKETKQAIRGDRVSLSTRLSKGLNDVVDTLNSIKK